MGTMLPLDALQEGDILLMMGEGPLSDLIAWASDGRYSHAAIVVDGGDLLEASLAGVRRVPLARRVAEYDHYHFIDAYRPHDRRERAYDACARGLVVAHAGGMLGRPYPVDQLALMGVVMAVRGKWPRHPLGRWLARVALDRALPAESPAMVCSEVVYRAWAECAVDPRGAMAPRIVEGPRGDARLPDIDWWALWEEFGPLVKARAPVLPQAGALLAGRGDAGAALAGALGDLPDAELERARREVLARLGAGAGADADVLLRSGAGGEAHGGAAGLPAPNPRLVSPQDLANSPSAALLGRLMQRPAA